MTKRFYWGLLASLLLFSACLFIFSTSKPWSNDDEFIDRRTNQLQVFALDLPKELNFAGENVPMDVFWVREAYDRELLTNVYWHSSTFLMIKRTNRFFPVIEPILKKNGVPDDFKYLALAESSLSNVVSPSGAAGYWQFMKETATSYGLEISDEVDERYNLEKSTEAACKFLLSSYQRFGSWTLAAAIYNAGQDNIAKPMSFQKGTDYYSTFLNPETSRYIFRILAIREILKNPEKFGFHLRKKDLYPVIPCQQIIVDTTINDLSAFAISKGLNYKILRELNPWIKKYSLTNKIKKSYILQLPDPKFVLYSNLMSE